MFTRLLLGSSLFGLLFISNCAKSEDKPQTQQRGSRVPIVSIYKITPKDVSYTFSTIGTIEADEVLIYARVSGVVTSVDFKEGDRVSDKPTNHKGVKYILAEIDPKRYQLEVERAEAARDKAKAGYTKAQNEYKSRYELFKKGHLSEDEVKRFEAAMNEANAFLSQLTADYKLAKKNEDESNIKSPSSGIIQSKHIVLGQYVRPETLVASLVDISNLRVRFNISESEAVRLGSKGKKIAFSLKSRPDLEFTADIYFVSSSANPKTRKVECKASGIKVKEKPENQGLSEKEINLLKPGYFVTIKMETDTHMNAIVIPSQAVLPKEDGFKVFILDKDNKARQRDIEIGLHTPEGDVEVLKGLDKSDTVIVLGAGAVKDGIEVKVTAERKEEKKKE